MLSLHVLCKRSSPRTQLFGKSYRATLSWAPRYPCPGGSLGSLAWAPPRGRRGRDGSGAGGPRALRGEGEGSEGVCGRLRVSARFAVCSRSEGEGLLLRSALCRFTCSAASGWEAVSVGALKEKRFEPETGRVESRRQRVEAWRRPLSGWSQLASGPIASEPRNWKKSSAPEFLAFGLLSKLHAVLFSAGQAGVPAPRVAGAGSGGRRDPVLRRSDAAGTQESKGRANHTGQIYCRTCVRVV